MIYLLTFLISISSYANLNFGKDFTFTKTTEGDIKEVLTEEIFSNNKLIESIDIDGHEYDIEYTIDTELNQKIKKTIKRYRSDFTAVAVIDNNTGAVIALADYTKKGSEFGINLALSSTHPAASVFKMITAANLLDKKDITVDSPYIFHGRGVTLYKNQLKKKSNRWSRSIKLKKAFAYSNNVVFGKAAIYDSNFTSLKNTSDKFGFNSNVVQFVDVPRSHILEAEDQYQLAELASGFNKKTVISPLHAAAMTSIVINDGVEKKPYIVKAVKDKRIDKVIWTPQYNLKRALTKSTAKSLQEMMKLTVKKGTARGTFRRRKLNRRLRELEIGGKTGSITGGTPYGKRDWFVSYAKPKNGESDLGISVAVMIINQKKWYIKAPVIARDIMNYYYSKDK